MPKTQHKPKTRARTIKMPKNDYQPSKAEQEQEINVPGASVETVRRAFFRLIKSKQ